jgi:uncharacterized damage-inducible protein DinB
MTSHWSSFAQYNAWANARLYAAVAGLPAARFHEDGGAFFGSLCGTLNHLLVADRIWMQRFTGEGDAPARLDAILHEDFGSLSQARAAEDRRICAWIDGLSADDLGGMLRYRRITAPDQVEQPLGEALTHFFNHQTHHRGQAHALVTRFGGRDAGPVLDLLAFQKEPAGAR